MWLGSGFCNELRNKKQMCLEALVANLRSTILFNKFAPAQCDMTDFGVGAAGAPQTRMPSRRLMCMFSDSTSKMPKVLATQARALSHVYAGQPHGCHSSSHGRQRLRCRLLVAFTRHAQPQAASSQLWKRCWDQRVSVPPSPRHPWPRWRHLRLEGFGQFPKLPSESCHEEAGETC